MFARTLALAFAVSIGAAAAASPQAAQQTIELRSYAYSPKPIHLAAGRPVTLTFVNRSGSSHDFTARAFFANSRILAGSAPRGEVELRGGESKSITLVPQRGTYKVHCSHFMHKQFGMTATIVVG